MSRVAAVDVGTNSVRLLVAERAALPSGQAAAGRAGAAPLRTVEREMRITRLGRGVDSTGRLDDAALARTLDALTDYAARWRELDAQRVRITATSAVRDASDRERFFSGVRSRTGVDAEVLSGEQEGAAAFLGATGQLHGEPTPFLVVDIGGGSTEFILGRRSPEAMTSRQLGCVRLTERTLGGDPPTPEEVSRARAVVEAELDEVEAAVRPQRAATVVGVAGTATTIAALHLGLPAYLPERIHGTRVPAAAVSALTARLLAMTAAERAALGPMAPGREDVIHGGALILERVLSRFGHADVLVSEADILDGLALSLLD